MRRKKLRLILVFMLAAACLVQAGCAAGTEDGRPVKILAEDKTIQCEAPPGWEAVSGTLNEVASLEAADEGENCFMIAITELSADFDVDLSGYNDVILENIRKTAEDVEIGETEETEVGGCPAFLTRMDGKVQGVKITYWISSVEFPQYYVQIMGWTLTGRAEQNEETILSVMKSVKPQ